MKLDCVITATNENPLYIEFIPLFVKTWNKLYPNVDVKIILIAEKIPEEYLGYKDNIILFEPIENVFTSFTSQFIRLLYPCLMNYENGVMITDMDILPMNTFYFTEHIEKFSNNKFIYFGEMFRKKHQIIMCYNVATPKIWKDIFGINSLKDIRNTIKTVFQKNEIEEGSGNKGWFIDQQFLYQLVMNWNKKTDNFVCLKEKEIGFRRLDRGTFNLNNRVVRLYISNGIFSDYHCYRPMSKYSEINNAIYELLPLQNKK